MSQTLIFYVTINELTMIYEQLNIYLDNLNVHTNNVYLINLLESVIKLHYKFLKICRYNRMILKKHICKNNQILLNRMVFTLFNLRSFYVVVKQSEIGHMLESLLHKLYQCKEMHQCVNIYCEEY